MKKLLKVFAVLSAFALPAAIYAARASSTCECDVCHCGANCHCGH